MNARYRLLLFSLALLAFNGLAFGVEEAAIGRFSSATPGQPLPASWQPYRFAEGTRETRFSIVSIGQRAALEAVAETSASALLHSLRVDPRSMPWLTFSWRTERLIDKADMRTKAGDDYPARLYVIFDYDISRLPFAERVKLRLARSIWGDQLPIAALCYVWEPRQPVGYTQWSAYTNRLRMIVVESGSARIGEWLEFERNVADDFRKAFGEEPPAITAILVATDTDNTGGSARTWFGDINLRSARSGDR